jgi:hypothetical protein
MDAMLVSMIVSMISDTMDDMLLTRCACDQQIVGSRCREVCPLVHVALAVKACKAWSDT